MGGAAAGSFLVHSSLTEQLLHEHAARGGHRCCACGGGGGAGCGPVSCTASQRPICGTGPADARLGARLNPFVGPSDAVPDAVPDAVSAPGNRLGAAIGPTRARRSGAGPPWDPQPGRPSGECSVRLEQAPVAGPAAARPPWHSRAAAPAAREWLRVGASPRWSRGADKVGIPLMSLPHGGPSRVHTGRLISGIQNMLLTR